MNTLATKIKAMKRELTNLKTSHKRGLGNLKIYQRQVTIENPSSIPSYADIVINIQFDTDFTPYPLVQIIPAMLTDESYSMDMVGMDYSNNGFRANARFVWKYVGGTNSFSVEATSPITSVNYTWEE